MASIIENRLLKERHLKRTASAPTKTNTYRMLCQDAESRMQPPEVNILEDSLPGITHFNYLPLQLEAVIPTCSAALALRTSILQVDHKGA